MTEILPGMAVSADLQAYKQDEENIGEWQTLAQGSLSTERQGNPKAPAPCGQGFTL